MFGDSWQRSLQLLPARPWVQLQAEASGIAVQMLLVPPHPARTSLRGLWPSAKLTRATPHVTVPRDQRPPSSLQMESGVRPAVWLSVLQDGSTGL